MSDDRFDKLIVVGFVILALCIIFGFFLFLSHEKQKQIMEMVGACTSICDSNGLQYYQVKSSNNVGSIITCYCKDDKGAISTRVM